MVKAHALAPAHVIEPIDGPRTLADDKLVDLPVPDRQYPASPAGIASFDAWWEGMLPEERALLESMAHSDKVDSPHHR